VGQQQSKISVDRSTKPIFRGFILKTHAFKGIKNSYWVKKGKKQLKFSNIIFYRPVKALCVSAKEKIIYR
jgi:hypothetical protein